MNYIYDILANFNDSFFDFYDWDNDDELIHIKKLPVLRVSSNFLYNIKYHDVVVFEDLLDKIYKKTDFFKYNKSKYSYVCAFCDCCDAVIVRFNSKGKIIGRSSFLIDEGNEVLDICEDVDIFDFKFVVNMMCCYDNFKTRKELQINDLIIRELKNMNCDKLRYLYFDCFDEFETNIDVILDKIIYEMKNHFDSIYSRIYDFLKLTSYNK